jgi:putative ATP-dependent endonuclease of the OLD family
MRLNKVSVKNYRTLEDVSVTFNGYYTAISGKNNAGKTSLIRCIRETFKDNLREFFYRPDSEVEYREDKTQWVVGTPEIVFEYELTVGSSDDPGLFLFVEKMLEQKLPDAQMMLVLRIMHKQKNETSCLVWVDGKELNSYSSKEILKKIQASSLAFMHDSADRAVSYFGPRGRYLHELMFSKQELSQLSEEQQRLQKKIANLSKAHKTELSDLLGHLEEKYEVEFTVPDGMFSGAVPFSINLKDKSVDVPLNDWGSGTKNRTQIMVSILQANRIRSRGDEGRITPFVIIEEPESFLHPSAQAEFGRVLMDLADELKIQTIVTTHSPYMLCQRSVSSNVLLDRQIVRGKSKQTMVVEVQEQNWMEPFSDILGLDNKEFSSWKHVLLNGNQSVLLVEGEIDKKYIEHINALGIDGFKLPEGIEIVPYEGKDALKNTILLKFIVEKFKRVIITFDLDAKSELERTMQQIGLKEGQDYIAVGVDKSGRQCIEGLLPERVIAKVVSENTDLVMQMGAADSKDRRSAKSALKGRYLAEFKSDAAIGADDLKGFAYLFKALSKAYEKVG